MPRQTQIKKSYSFIGGLNTDSGYLQQVPNSWKDGDNITPFLDGHIERRVKIDLEHSYALSPTFTSEILSDYAFSVDLWRNVGGLGALSFAVVQVGNLVYFYDCISSTVSTDRKSFSIDLITYKNTTSTNRTGVSPISITSGNGKLVIVSEDIDPILVSYDLALDSITVVRLTLKIRDFYGLVDITPVTTNPVTLTDIHHYNLLNQGWSDDNIDAYFASTGTYPDDTQMWIQGKDSSDNFSPTVLDKQDFGTGSAPKGRYILDAFYKDRATASGIAALDVEIEDYRPTTTAFFAGRAWYAGIQSPNMSSFVFFSRIVDTDIKFEQCYQEGDPTAEYSSDLVASDGGVIPIPGAGSIRLLKPIQNSLLVFAENGIWQISGDTSGFSATGYQVKQIASFGILSPRSVVDVENTVAFWSTAGIYMVDKDQVSGDFVTKSISLGKIQTMYSEMQETCHSRYVQGFYDSINKIVYWMHHLHLDGEPIGETDRFHVENFLMYDLTLGAFYTYSVKKDSALASIVGGFVSPTTGNAVFDITVTAGGATVVTGSTGVIVEGTSASVGPRIPKFLTVVSSGSDYAVTFSDFLNLEDTPNKFMDWFTVNGVGEETTVLPFVITGYDLEDDGARNHQAPYIITHLIRTETGFDSSLNPKNPSSCVLQGRWEWTDNSIASRWTSGEQVYRHRNLYVPTSISDTYQDGYPLLVSKSILRGYGKALQLKYNSASGKEMKIAGWSIQYMINSDV